MTDNFDALYALLKPKGVTVSAMLANAVAEVLKKHPIVNAAYVEGGIKYNKGAYGVMSCVVMCVKFWLDMLVLLAVLDLQSISN